MAKTPKVINDAVAQTVEKIGAATAEAMKNMDMSDLPKGQSKGFGTLKELADTYEIVDVFIYRYNEPVKGSESPAFFTEFKGQPIQAVMAERPEVLCKREGGGGLYTVEVVSDDGRHKVVFPKLRVSGNPLPIPRSDAEAASMMGYIGGNGGLPTTVSSGKSSSLDPMVRLIEAQFKAMQSDKKVTNPLNDMMMMAMFQKMQDAPAVAAAASPQQSDYTRKLEEKIAEMDRRLEQQQAQVREQQLLNEMQKQKSEWEAKFNEMKALMSQSSEKSELRRLEEKIENSGSKTNSTTDLITTLLTTSQNDKNSTQALFLGLLDKMAGQKDTGYQDLAKTMTEQTLTNLNILTQMAQANMLGGAAGGATPADVLMKVFEGIEKTATAYIAGMSEEEEEEEELPERRVSIELQQRAEENRRLQAASQAASQEQQEQKPEESEEEEEPQVTQEQLLEFLSVLTEDQIPDEAKVTEDELARLKSSSSWRSMLKALREQSDCKEATARLFAIAESGDRLARRFMTYPVFVGWQVMTPMGFGDMVAPLTQDILQFWAFINEENGNPNEWCPSYRPIKEKAPAPAKTEAKTDAKAPNPAE